MVLNLLTFWRKPKSARRQATVAATPVPLPAPREVAIDHHPGLIAELRAEHAALLKAYGDVGAAMQNEEWAAVALNLGRLRSMLTDHLLKEGVKLYCYLQRVLDEDDDTYRLFRDFKTEMGGIGKVAFAFVDRYANVANLQSPSMQAAFASEYQTIGAVLTGRIEREEAQLYPLYQLPDAGAA